MGHDDHIFQLFIDDARDHLADIEACLMDVERGDADDELVNKIFRAAHSIKSGAGFLGLENIRDLSHKLENLLHLVRNKERGVTTRLINVLFQGFDRLRALVEQSQDSNAQDISGILASLSELTAENLSSEDQQAIAASVTIRLPDHTPIFVEDLFSLRQSLKGDKLLYLVNYDLIHDVHARGKTPLDIISAMESSGLIIDCKMDLAAVGDLDDPVTNAIPFYVLFATIVEPDVISYLFALDSERIAQVDLEALAPVSDAAEAPPPTQAASTMEWTREFDGVSASGNGISARLVVNGPIDVITCRNLRDALLLCLEKGLNAVLDIRDLEKADICLLQVLAAAGRAFAQKNARLEHAVAPPEALALAALRAGFTSKAMADAGIPETIFRSGQPQ
jgi:two-component system, chemotaxis family, sensor kinase CheA